MSNRIGGWIQTFTGVAFYPLDARPEDIDIIDIAHSLSMQCRYAGHCERFYSVAEHCCLIYDVIEPEYKLQALLHDASEAYLVDVPRPIKPELKEYKTIETNLEKVIFQTFNVPYPFHPRVKEFDTRILLAEKEQNMPPGPDWQMDGIEPLDVTLKFWSPEKAEAEFLLRFLESFAGINLRDVVDESIQ